MKQTQTVRVKTSSLTNGANGRVAKGIRPAVAIKRDVDFYGWCLDQASALRNQRSVAMDWTHLAEELETMGAAEKRELRKCLRSFLMHLIKWQLQPHRRTSSWRRSISNRRDDLKDLIDISPSLSAELDSIFSDAYQRGRRDALAETRLRPTVVPEICPWTRSDVLREDFWPGPHDSSSSAIARIRPNKG
jgi:hypothetical protein